MSPHLSFPDGRRHDRNPRDQAESDLETRVGLFATGEILTHPDF